jgi:hypothetical protein
LQGLGDFTSELLAVSARRACAESLSENDPAVSTNRREAHAPQVEAQQAFFVAAGFRARTKAIMKRPPICVTMGPDIPASSRNRLGSARHMRVGSTSTPLSIRTRLSSDHHGRHADCDGASVRRGIAHPCGGGVTIGQVCRSVTLAAGGIGVS